MNFYLNLLSVLFLRLCISETIGSEKPKQLWNETDLDRLKKDLFTNYNKLSIPTNDQSSIKVKLALGISHIESNEMESSVTIKGWMGMTWIDQNLKWNISLYRGINFAKLANHEIWKPDLYLQNGILGAQSLTTFSNTNIILSSIGKVLFMPIIKLSAICKFNFRYWPFDTQYCHFDIGSLRYNKKEVTFTLYDTNVNNTKRSSSWYIRNSTEEILTKYYRHYHQQHYSLAQFRFIISRRSDSYTSVVVTPAVVLSIFIMVQFWLQPDSHVRLILNGVTSIILVMHFTYFNHHTFGIGSNTPLIVIFYGVNLLMVCCSLAGTCFGYALAQMKQTAYVPWTFRQLLNGKLGKFIFLQYQSGNKFPTAQRYISYSENNIQMKNYKMDEWLFATAINRILFWIYLILFLITFIVYIIFVCLLSNAIN